MSYRSPLQVARDIYGRYVSSEKHDRSSEEDDEKGEIQEGNDVSPVANGGLDQIQATEARDTTGPARTAARETLAEELEQMKKTMLELEARAVAAEQKNAKLREHSVYEVPPMMGKKRPTLGRKDLHRAISQVIRLQRSNQQREQTHITRRASINHSHHRNGTTRARPSSSWTATTRGSSKRQPSGSRLQKAS